MMLEKIWLALRAGAGWGGILASGVGAISLLANYDPAYEVMEGNSALVGIINKYRETLSPIFSFLSESLDVDVTQAMADRLSFVGLLAIAAIFKGNNWTRAQALVTLIFSFLASNTSVFAEAVKTENSLDIFSVLASVFLPVALVLMPLYDLVMNGRRGGSMRLLDSGLMIVIQLVGAMLAVAGLSALLSFSVR